jgi:CheY-like chemotaxis protein
MAKILVVDDEKNVVELLSFVFSKEGHTVYTASNGREALEKIGLLPTENPPVRPDLVVLDIMMPETDGYTVQTKMLEDESTRSIPIVILTAKGQMRELFGMSSNVAAYIEKPFDPKMLSHKIKEILKEK